MKKLAIVFDSFVATNFKVLEKDGYFYLPHNVTIDGVSYLDGVNLTSEKAITLLKKTTDARSSLPTGSRMVKLFEKLKGYDDVIYLPVGSAISGTYQAARLIAQKFKNVHVVDNWIPGRPAYYYIANKIKAMYKQNKSLPQILQVVKEWNKKIVNYILPATTAALLRGGRIKRSLNYIAQKISLAPVLTYSTTLRVKSVTRTQKKAIVKAVRFLSPPHLDPKKFFFVLGHTNNTKKIRFTRDEIKKALGTQKISEFLSSPLVMVHVGVGGISVSAIPIIT